MDTSSSICILRRFFAIRKPANILRCEKGTNYLGGKAELENVLHEMDQEFVQKYLSQEGCLWMLNPPYASHFGGAWERQIGTARRVLDVVSGIVNARRIAILSRDPDRPKN